MYEFRTEQDTITVIVANVDVESAKTGNYSGQRVDVTLSSLTLSQPYQETQTGLKVKLGVTDAALWRYFISEEIRRFDAAPNPFRLNAVERLLLPINEDKASIADVYFYTSSLSLAYSGKQNVLVLYGTRVIEVPASVLKSKLGSGIYFVIAKTASSEYTWKVAVIQ